MKRVAIVGGGITGLSAAHYLETVRRGGTEVEWTLFEKSSRLGGVIRTEYREGCVLEAGPDSFLSVKPEAAELCRDLGIGDDIIQSNDFQRKTYILVKGRLVPIPDGLQFMVPTRVLPMATTSLFSIGAKLRMAVEWFSRAGNQHQDESVAAFVRRHFGQQMVDRVAEPLLAGVYGGSAERLSLRAVLPRFAEMERQHGSLVRATLKAMKQSGTPSPQPLFTSLRNGMQQLANALVARLPEASLRLNQQQVSLRRLDDGWQVCSSGEAETFNAVFMAIPAPLASAVLLPVDPQLAGLLGKIQYTSSAAVLIAYQKPALPPGFGFLIPASEGRRMLACTFVHNKFPHRAPQGTALLRCFFTSSRVQNLASLSDQDLESVARQELAEILELRATPQFSCAYRWSYGLPQYETGHLELAAGIEAQLQQMPGLQLIGNSLYGIGVPDCIRSAKQAVEKVL